MGHILTNAGLKPDEENIQAFTYVPAPPDMHHLRRLVSKFDHSLTRKCKLLNWLTRKDQVFQWSEGKQRAFEAIRKVIANTPVLAYYDLEKPVKIMTDMSDVVVRAVLLQNGRAVSYKSMVWNTSEKNYTPN